MRLTTIMKGGLIACTLLSLSVNLVAQGGGSLKAAAGKTGFLPPGVTLPVLWKSRFDSVKT